MTTLQLMSWGAGVQSTAIALLIEQGHLPRPDAWLWADTGDEPEAVYAHVEKWEPRLDAMAPFIRVSKGGVRARLGDAVIAKALTGKGSNTLPFFLEEDGRVSLTQRGCTFNYKRHPLEKAAERLAKAQGATGFRWWLGISKDEMQRMKVGMYHPLVETFDGKWRPDAMTRNDCLKVIAATGETAPRSSCVFCPFRRPDEWAVLSPKDRARVIEVDRALQTGFDAIGKHGTLTDRPYLRRDATPVTGDAWFDVVDNGQLTLSFDDECEGICGV